MGNHDSLGKMLVAMLVFSAFSFVALVSTAGYFLFKFLYKFF